MNFWDFYGAHPVLGGLAGSAILVTTWTLAMVALVIGRDVAQEWLQLKYAPEPDDEEDDDEPIAADPPAYPDEAPCPHPDRACDACGAGPGAPCRDPGFVAENAAIGIHLRASGIDATAANLIRREVERAGKDGAS